MFIAFAFLILRKQGLKLNRISPVKPQPHHLSFVTIQTALHASLAPRYTFANAEINFNENLFIASELNR